jgi:DNA polymerase III sliding clamp (beta) subunit (PCNA family)
VIRPFKRIIEQVAAESRLFFDADGIRFSVVDSGNVLMSTGRLYADALEGYNVSGERVIGVDMDSLGSALQNARYEKSESDYVFLKSDGHYLESTVERDLGETTATLTEQVGLIDPDSIRCVDDDVADDGIEIRVELSTKAFSETLSAFDLSTSAADIKFEAGDGQLSIRQEGDINKRRVSLDLPEIDPAGVAMYRPKYLSHIRTQVNSGLIDSLAIRYGEDWPVYVEMEREGVYEVESMLAPRVRQ